MMYRIWWWISHTSHGNKVQCVLFVSTVRWSSSARLSLISEGFKLKWWIWSSQSQHTIFQQIKLRPDRWARTDQHFLLAPSWLLLVSTTNWIKLLAQWRWASSYLYTMYEGRFTVSPQYIHELVNICLHPSIHHLISGLLKFSKTKFGPL